MEHRVNIEQRKPEAYKSLYLFSVTAGRSSLAPLQKHLITIRTSQINSCAFCINMHTKEALASGETQQRIFLISAWKETTIFSEEEKAILALTEEIALIHQNGVTEETYAKAASFFNEDTIADIILYAVQINAWNRIAVSTHTPLGK